MKTAIKELKYSGKYVTALRAVVETQQVSQGFVQRKVKVGFAAASVLIREFEQIGAIGPDTYTAPRTVLWRTEDLKRYLRRHILLVLFEKLGRRKEQKNSRRKEGENGTEE